MFSAKNHSILARVYVLMIGEEGLLLLFLSVFFVFCMSLLLTRVFFRVPVDRVLITLLRVCSVKLVN